MCQAQVRFEWSLAEQSWLKHGTGRFEHVVLVPQPSDDPNDPLNVSRIYILSTKDDCTCQQEGIVAAVGKGNDRQYFLQWRRPSYLA